MTSCEKIQEMISAMLDGELSESEKKTVEEHIAVCPECAAMYADFAAISSGLSEMSAEVPATLHAKIMKGVRVSQKPKRPVLIQLRPYLSTAACLVVIVAAVFAMRGGSAKSDSLAVPAAPQAPAAAVAEAPMEKADNSFAVYSAPEPECEAADAGEDMAYGDVESAPGEPEVDCNGAIYLPDAVPGDAESLKEHLMALYSYSVTRGHIKFSPRTDLEAAYLGIVTEDGSDMVVREIHDLDALCSVLEYADDDWETIGPCAAVLETYRNGHDYCFRLSFDGDRILVETIEGAYYAAGTVEELLSIE